MRKALKPPKIENVLAFLILLTASFDIFGVLDINGITLRISQLFIVLAIVLLCFWRQRISFPRGITWMLLWLFLQLIAALRSTNYKYSLGYFAWSMLSVGIIFLFYNFFDSTLKIDALLRMFVCSFVAIAVLGMIQWILQIIGISFYLTQPTLNGTNIPRLNGFTYEPSYYATYLLPGWVLVMYLMENGSCLFTKKQLIVYTILISLALFLSTSRMGWIFIGIWLVFRGFAFIRRFMVGKMKRGNIFFFILIFFCTIGVIILSFVLIKKRGIEFMISGLGVGGTSDHSSAPRITSMLNTLKMINESPLIGLSLGGLSVKFCEVYHIFPFDTGATMCVWAELFSASGILGFSFFIIWFICLFIELRKKKKKSPKRIRETTGLVYALIFECMILALNQNILRIYFWTLLAVAVAVSRREHPTESILESLYI